jgi:hypothetical protein
VLVDGLAKGALITRHDLPHRVSAKFATLYFQDPDTPKIGGLDPEGSPGVAGSAPTYGDHWVISKACPR